MENVTYKSVVNTHAILDFIMAKLHDENAGNYEYDLKRLKLLSEFQQFVSENSYVAKIENEA